MVKKIRMTMLTVGLVGVSGSCDIKSCCIFFSCLVLGVLLNDKKNNYGTSGFRVKSKYSF